jgi:hypothetical protein
MSDPEICPDARILLRLEIAVRDGDSPEDRRRIATRVAAVLRGESAMPASAEVILRGAIADMHQKASQIVEDAQDENKSARNDAILKARGWHEAAAYLTTLLPKSEG